MEQKKIDEMENLPPVLKKEDTSALLLEIEEVNDEMKKKIFENADTDVSELLKKSEDVNDKIDEKLYEIGLDPEEEDEELIKMLEK